MIPIDDQVSFKNACQFSGMLFFFGTKKKGGAHFIWLSGLVTWEQVALI